MQVRIIMQSDKSGRNEYVRFETEDFDTPLKDFKMQECISIEEEVMDIELPSAFPTCHDLKRVM